MFQHQCTYIQIVAISWRSVWRILVALDCQQRVQPLRHQHCEAIHFLPAFTKRNPFIYKNETDQANIMKKDWYRAVHECCCGQRRATMLNENWHQLFSIPTVVSLVSFHLFTILSKFIPNTKFKDRISSIVIISWISAGDVLTFNNFMIFQCVLWVGFTLGRLLRLSCFRRKMGAVRGNWRTIIYIYDMLVAHQRPPRGLPIKLISDFNSSRRQ